MVVAFNIILLIIIFTGFIGTVAKDTDRETKLKLTSLSIAAMISFLISGIYL